MSDQSTNSGAQVAPREVDRIRDIILGPHLRDFDQRFQSIQRDVERLQQEIDRLTDQLSDQESEQNKKLQALRRDMRQGDDDLRGELRQSAQKLADEKVDRLALGDLFIELGEHLKAGGSLVELLKGLNSIAS